MFSGCLGNNRQPENHPAQQNRYDKSSLKTLRWGFQAAFLHFVRAIRFSGCLGQTLVYSVRPPPSRVSTPSTQKTAQAVMRTARAGIFATSSPQ